MPFSVVRVGQVLGARADRIAIARLEADDPRVITLVWNGNKVKHTIWSLPPNGSLTGNEVDAKPGGPEVAIACYSETRVVSMHRSGPAGALKIEAWKTGEAFELSDDHVWTNDRDPVILPFGADPGILSGPPPFGARDPAERPLKASGLRKIGLKPKAGRAVIVSRTGANRLRLSFWGFDDGGEPKVLVRMSAEADGGPATVVSAAKLRESWTSDGKLTSVEILTASRGEGNVLQLKRWLLNLGSQGTPAAFQLLSELTAPETIHSVSAVPVRALSGIQAVTAAHVEDGTLKLTGWKMEPGGGITRWVDAAGGAITAVHAAEVTGRTIVTAMREADGRFKASYWRFPANESGAVEHLGDAVEGKVGAVTCAHVPGEGSQLGDTVAAVQSEEGKLQLWRYRVTD